MLEDVKLMLSKISNLQRYKGVMLVGSDIFANAEINEIVNFLVSKGMKITLPSIKLEDLEKMCDLLKEAKLESITIAPETSEKLRMAIGKNFTNDDVINAAHLLKKIGLKKVKLYFMIGLPYENMDDIEEVVRLINKFKAEFDGKVSVTFSIFVPKAHTPFQFAPLDDISLLEKKNMFLRKRVKRCHLTNPKKARIQAWLSIGNKEISEILLRVHERMLNYSAWIKESKRCKVNLDIYCKEKDTDFNFDFNSIDFGISHEKLYKIYQNYKKKVI
jgi:radical SAM superfamily enzyme YgiQ (UPF0313 family)